MAAEVRRSSAGERLRAWLFAPVDNAPLIAFRIAFGLLTWIESFGAILTGWVGDVFVSPVYTFPHVGFGWLAAFHGPAVYAHYALMSVPAFLVMVGAFYRVSIVLFTAMWAVTYFAQTTAYNNHYYLLLLLGILMSFLPANACVAWDARRVPALRSALCARWCIVLLAAQVAIVYFFAALAKLNPDWLAGRPIAIWLQAKSHYPILGPLYQQEWIRWFIVYGGILFDGLVVPLLLWRRTRWLAVAMSFFFHLFNSYTFRVGVFPYLGIAFCVLFFPGEQVRRLLFRRAAPAPARDAAAPRRRQNLVMVALAAYLALQIALPLRHWLYPGNVDWTEEGHRMSWRMMLRNKAGSATFRAVDRASGESLRVDTRDLLGAKQASRIATRPDMLWRFARIVRDRYAAEGRDVAVYVTSRVSLNGHPPRPLVDPDVDLSRAPWHWLTPQPWILPFDD
jgi:hypothetical protein